MARRRERDWTVEEYHEWREAEGGLAAVAEAADEEGGPRLSLVPASDRGEVWPTDLLPPAAPEPSEAGERAQEAPGETPTELPAEAMPFDGVPLEESRKRLAGWSAERQRVFLTNLAETGSVHLASAAARLTARSAYRLRARSPAFARPGTRRTSSPSGASPRSPSTARSTAAPSRSGRRAFWWPRSACRATGC